MGGGADVCVCVDPLRNLLGEAEKLDIKMNPDGSGQLYVPGLTQVSVHSPEDIHRVSALGGGGPSAVGSEVT